MKKILSFLNRCNIGSPPWKQGFQWRKFQDGIGEPPWNYYFLQNLPESEYPKYLAKLFYLNTGERLPLRHGVIDKRRCITFNQILQWLKLYGVTPLIRDCTDKVKVRDYVKEKIGEEYLKPVLQIIPAPSLEAVIARNDSILGDEAIQEEAKQKTLAENLKTKSINRLDCRGTEKAVVPRNDNKFDDVTTYFDKIDFDKLPNSFVIKTNHGCKWQYIIKNKEEYLKNKRLFDITKKQMTGWLEQDYTFWGGFELNYRGIKPKILIEALMREEQNKDPVKINVYCFNGEPKIFVKFFDENKMSIWNEKFEPMENIFNFPEINIKNKADDFINQTFDRNFRKDESNRADEIEVTGNPTEQQNCDSSFKVKSRISMKEISRLSEELSKEFKFVRIDWMIYQNKLYFEEMTFTPYSGFHIFKNPKYNFTIGKLIKGDKK